MDNEIIQSVIEITRQRDIDALEYSLIATLAEVSKCNKLSLSKLNTTTQEDVMEEVVKFSLVEDENGNAEYLWNKDPILVKIEKDVGLCIDTQETVSLKSNNLFKLIIPFYLKGEVYGVVSVASVSDLTESRPLIEGLIRIYSNHLLILDESEHDKLTGLLNRRTFEKKLHRLLSIQKHKKIESDAHTKNNLRLVVSETTAPWLAMIDIDYFKRINDKWGHVIGDEVLLRVSQMMQDSFRNSDMLFRFGGEEFLVLLEPIPETMAGQVFERFREKVATTDLPRVGNITLSIGFTQVHENLFPADMLEKADRALYFAKNNGRNAVYQYEQLIADKKLADRAVSTPIELF